MNEGQLQQFRNRLVDLREQLRSEIQEGIEAIDAEIHPVGEDPHEPREGLESELAVVHGEERMHQAVSEALRRIDKGTFGVCVACGRTVPQARLDAIPYAACCIDCERMTEKQQPRPV